MDTVTKLGLGFAFVGAAALATRRARHSFHSRCLNMIAEMEFGEKPSCPMCYEMHQAMHRRMEREAAGAEVGQSGAGNPQTTEPIP